MLDVTLSKKKLLIKFFLILIRAIAGLRELLEVPNRGLSKANGKKFSSLQKSVLPSMNKAFQMPLPMFTI